MTLTGPLSWTIRSSSDGAYDPVNGNVLFTRVGTSGASTSDTTRQRAWFSNDSKQPIYICVKPAPVQITDCVTTLNSTVIQSASQKKFTQLDLGSLVTVPNFPSFGVFIVGLVGSDPTKCQVSQFALGAGSGLTANIGSLMQPGEGVRLNPNGGYWETTSQEQINAAIVGPPTASSTAVLIGQAI